MSESLVLSSNVPALAVRPEAEPRGTVLFLHGYRARKEDHAKELTALAAAGFFAVAPDAPHHGARDDGTTARMEEASPADFWPMFLDLVIEIARELPSVVDAAVAAGPGAGGRVGVIGMSMGGYELLAALPDAPRIDAAVTLVASPDWSPPHGGLDERVRAKIGGSPAAHPELFVGRPLLLINGGKDGNVPAAPPRAFAEAVRARARDAGDEAARLAIAYAEYPESGHFFRHEDWDDAWGRVSAWLDRHLCGRDARNP